MKIIKELKEQIDIYDKLSLKEAKELYLQMINTKDKGEQKELKDKLILGTLYNVFDIINSRKDLLINGRDYDQNDIVSSLSEYWITAITNGDILNCKSFKELFMRDKIARVLLQLVDNKNLPYSGLNNSLLYSYLKLKFENNNLTFKEYFDNMLNLNTVNLYDYYAYQDAYLYFENMWNRLDLNNKKDFKLVLQHVIDSRYLLLHEGLFEDLKENTVTYEIEQNIVNKLFDEHFRKEFIEYISKRFNQRDQEIIEYLYGLKDGEYHTYSEAGEMYGLSTSVIGNIAKKVLNKAAIYFKDYYFAYDGERINHKFKW